MAEAKESMPVLKLKSKSKKKSAAQHDSRQELNSVTWEHPFGSSFFENVAIIFDISKQDAKEDWAAWPHRIVKQDHDRVMMVVLSSE
jgi:hypothetical protein